MLKKVLKKVLKIVILTEKNGKGANFTQKSAQKENTQKNFTQKSTQKCAQKENWIAQKSWGNILLKKLCDIFC